MLIDLPKLYLVTIWFRALLPDAFSINTVREVTIILTVTSLSWKVT